MTATIPASELIALNQPKTELEEARAHLLNVQQRLAAARKGDVFLIGPNECIAPLPPDMMREREREVLAALSWVWDAQQREGPNIAAAFDAITLSAMGVRAGTFENGVVFEEWDALRLKRGTHD